MSRVLDYIRAHMGEMVVIGVMSAVSVGIGLAVGMHPLDVLAHGRR